MTSAIHVPPFRLALSLIAITSFTAFGADLDLILRGGTVYDGSGGPPVVANVGIARDRIVAVGDLAETTAKQEIDVRGLAVAPGFINMLSWSVESLIEDGRSQSDIRQGVTLEVFGEGMSWGPWNRRMRADAKQRQGDIHYDIEWTTLAEYLNYLVKRGVSPNVASFVGAGTVRVHQIGYEDRTPTPAELRRMKRLVRRSMQDGALGLGSSLIYAPACYAKTEELIELCKVVAEYDGLYITHMRSEGNRLLEGVEEVFRIARESGVRAEIYHLKAAGQANWPKMDRVIDKINAAREAGLKITADMYTYTAGATGLDAAMPPWVQEGGYEAWVERLKEPATRLRVMREMRTHSDEWENLLLLAGSAEKVLLVGFRNEKLKPLTGKTLGEVARLRGSSPEETAIDLVVEDGSRVGTVYFLMSEENVRKQIQLPWVSFGSDSESATPEGVFLKSSTHPRAYGNFARLLGKYVRDEKLISLPEAIRRLTALPASNLRIQQRGSLKPGYFADLVVFDPAKIQDHATYSRPQQFSTGVVHVFVNGQQVIRDGEHTGATPGRVVHGPGRLLSRAAVVDERPLREPVANDDFVVREARIPMRDGVKLYTIIMTPKGADKRMPIIVNRTPYDATRFWRGPASTRLGINIGTQFLGSDYIYVAQDIRGRFKSDGEYIMFRPPRGPLNDTETDHTTDTWDTIEWLVNNVESNGRVGVWGTSYPGWLTLAAIKDPHPSLAAAVPFNPVVDVWKADDWFHWGAFRGAFAFGFVYLMQSRTDHFTRYPYEKFDFFQLMLDYGSLGSALGDRLDDRHEMWTRIVENPAYGPVWQTIAADQWFDAPRRLVPTLHVHGLWDQEDIYGSPAVYAAIEKHDQSNDTNYFAAGPWYHGQHFATGDRLGDLCFDEATSVRFRQDVLKPFLRRYLHDEEGPEIAPVTVFETGANRWRKFDAWPPKGTTVRLYLQPAGGLEFARPEVEASVTEYVSDPAKPVPYAPRPNWAVNYDLEESVAAWRSWLVEDQRFVDGRTDVATWISEPLEEPLTVRGGVTARLFAETTGTDADWVVKLIDVYPDPAAEFVKSGYQLMVSGDIFRGRYREDYENPKPVEPDQALQYRIPMPHVNHRFEVGHRLMVQIQSSWFPLYDRNPQTYVDNIMFASKDAYQAQRHRIHHDRRNATHLELRVDSAD